MAGYELIDRHIDSLRRDVAWRPDADDLADELRDHLYTAADRLIAADIDLVEAQQRAIGRFGEPSTVAMSFATEGTRGLAVPTTFTQTAGVLAYIAAAAWALLTPLWVASEAVERSTGTWDGIPQLLFMLGAAALLVAASMTCMVLAGVHQRHGGLGIVGIVGIAFCSLGAASSVMFSWFVHLWGGLIALGVLLVAVPVVRRGIAPRGASVLFAVSGVAGWSIGVVTWLLRVGPSDEWGWYPVALLIAVGVGTFGWAAGLVGLGRWLHAEHPVEPPATVAA